MTDARPAAARPKKKASPAAEARQAEAEDGFVIIQQRGLSLRLPIAGKIPLAAIDCFRAGDNYGGTKAMLGEKQWEALVNAGATSDDLDELGKKLNASSGN